MDTSANHDHQYQKFRQFQDEDENRSAKDKRKSTMLVSLVIIAATAVLVIAVISVTSIVLGTQQYPEQASGLSSLNNTPGELSGRYYAKEGEGGIIFQTTANASFVFLSITTHDGELVVQILHSTKTSMTMFDTDNEDFLVLESTSANKHTFEEYLMPKNMTKMIESMMKKGENMTESILEHMDNKTVSEIRQFSLEKLAMSKVAYLIIEAAEALGYNITLGVDGTNNPAARVFFLLALQLSKARESGRMTASPTVAPSHDATKTTSHSRRRRADDRGECIVDDEFEPITSSHSCPVGRYPTGTECFGMCGKGNDCWPLICGDCCVHTYCLEHDRCCRERGFFTWPCISVLWRKIYSSCDEQYDC